MIPTEEIHVFSFTVGGTRTFVTRSCLTRPDTRLNEEQGENVSTFLRSHLRERTNCRVTGCKSSRLDNGHITTPVTVR